MTDLVITAANVVKGANARVDHGTAGEAVTAGQAVFLDAATDKYMLTDVDGEGTTGCKGIALHAASANQPLAVQQAGDITIGATLTPGTAYFASDTAGGIMPNADLEAGMTVTFLGIATSASILALSIRETGVEL